MSKLKTRVPRGTFDKLFSSMAPGDIKTIPFGKYKLGTLRTKAGALNSLVGYTRYSVSADSLTETIRLICAEKES